MTSPHSTPRKYLYQNVLPQVYFAGLPAKRDTYLDVLKAIRYRDAWACGHLGRAGIVELVLDEQRYKGKLAREVGMSDQKSYPSYSYMIRVQIGRLPVTLLDHIILGS